MREDRLRLFDQYDRSVPSSLYAFTQMTAEAVSDDEYLDAMYEKMRVRGALIGVESFTEQGLKDANKTWNPVGERMVEAIQKIQSHGIFVLASIINGLESDTVETLQTMRDFAIASGTAFAQFPIYSVYPGTKDYHEMLRDWKNRDVADYVPKHAVQMISEKFWLDFDHTEVNVKHPTMSSAEIEREVRASWRSFYSLSAIIKRTQIGPLRRLSPIGKFVYAVTCLVFYTLYPDGIAADNARKMKLSLMARLRVRVLIAVTRRTGDWFGTRAPRSPVKSKQEVFAAEPRSSTFGAGVP
jgi:radical SAM superfamily enzyme YgiQ (UPF0313 family)